MPVPVPMSKALAMSGPIGARWSFPLRVMLHILCCMSVTGFSFVLYAVKGKTHPACSILSVVRISNHYPNWYFRVIPRHLAACILRDQVSTFYVTSIGITHCHLYTCDTFFHSPRPSRLGLLYPYTSMHFEFKFISTSATPGVR